MKILNIKYPIFFTLFFALFSLFFVAAPVFAQGGSESEVESCVACRDVESECKDRLNRISQDCYSTCSLTEDGNECRSNCDDRFSSIVINTFCLQEFQSCTSQKCAGIVSPTPPSPLSACTEATLKDKKYKGPEFKSSAILPLCVYFEGFSDLEKTCGCRNINVLVSLLTKFATWLFGIVGAAALVVFIYGGFVILTAAGSAERVKKGKEALIAAVIGLVIVFTAQMIVKFIKDIVGFTEL